VAVNVDNLIKLRGKLNTVAKSKISVNDMVIKAASLACVRVPETNSQWLGEAIRKFNNVNMSVAVQTDFGLMAPTLFNTHLKGLEEIAAEVKDIAARARENKLKPEELSGGTFTISNLGLAVFLLILTPAFFLEPFCLLAMPYTFCEGCKCSCLLNSTQRE
jgi:pyruvate dehydrogenase E2 component (dihydrolipoamide acetyltransferase)